MNITISIPYELNVRLKEIGNRSGLITELLRKYFDDDFENIEMLEARVKELQDQHKERVEVIKDKIRMKKKDRQIEEDDVKSKKLTDKIIKEAVTEI